MKDRLIALFVYLFLQMSQKNVDFAFAFSSSIPGC